MVDDAAKLGSRCGDLLVVFGDQGASIRGRDGDGDWSLEFAGEGWKLLSRPPSARWRGFPMRTVRSGGWRLWRLGETYGAPADENGFLLEIASGRRPARDLNGHLLLVGWNEDDQQWHVWTDRFGTIHVYTGSRGSNAAIGTFYPAVAAASGSARKLDWSALAGYFALGFFPGTRSFFEDVKIQRPATHAVFDRSGRPVAEERYWSWRHEPDSRLTYGEAVDEFASVLHGVLDEQSAGGRLAVPVSGGLDSRTTVAALTRKDALNVSSLWSYSYGYSRDSVETTIARQVAEARSLPFEALTIEPYLFERLGVVLASVEGFQDVTQSRQATITQRLAAGADAVVAAHWGDVWHDDMGLADRPGATSTEVLEHALSKTAKRGRRWLLDELVAPHLGEAPESIVRRLVAEELDRLPPIADADFRLKAFKTEQWSFRWTLASIRMHQAGAFPRLPFYDTRMSDFFARLPTEYVRGRRLQIDYLKRYAPDLARIRWQAYDTNLYRYRYFDSLLLPSRAFKKAKRLWKGTTAVERNWEIQFSGESGRRDLEAALRGARLGGLVAWPRVQDLLDAFYGSPLEEGRGYTVSMLLTLSSWLEAYG
jgi:hypothetical protein